jgi:predicted PurR-regulated permease PerM
MLKAQSIKDQVAFYLLLAVLAALTFWLIRAYLDIIAFSLMTVIIIKPLYDRLLRWLGGRAGLAVILTLVLFALAVVVPLWIAARVIVGQLSALIASAQGPGGLQVAIGSINESLQQRLGAQLTSQQQQQLGTIAARAASWLAEVMVNLGMAIPDLISRAFIFAGILGTLLPNYHAFVQRLKRLSPLDDPIDDLFLRKIKLMVWARFLSIFVIAVAQGLVMGLFFWLAGVPYTPLWTLIAVVLAMFPLGASLIALPLGVIELLLGNYAAGAIILAGYLLVVSNVDSLLRPRLVPKDAYLNPALVLLSALGGYTLFGFFGVVYGPVLMILMLTALEVYEQYYSSDTPSAPPSAQREAAVVPDGAPSMPGAPPSPSVADETISKRGRELRLIIPHR